MELSAALRNIELIKESQVAENKMFESELLERTNQVDLATQLADSKEEDSRCVCVYVYVCVWCAIVFPYLTCGMCMRMCVWVCLCVCVCTRICMPMQSDL